MAFHHRLHALLLALPLLLAACDGAQQRLDDAVRKYDANDWTGAYAQAVLAQDQAQPPLSQRAAFVAGLAAYRQDRFDEARRRFDLAQTCTDPKVAGEARLMLGEICIHENRPNDAADLYDQAAQLLQGDAAARARTLASDARAQASAATTAKPAPVAEPEPERVTAVPPAPRRATPEPSRSAARASKPAAPPSKSAARSSSGNTGKGFTIQCGAYVKESDARKRAKDITDEAKRAGLPAPTVRRVTGRTGKRLWIVSVGSFTTRDAGRKALARLKVKHAEVLPREG
ncbi:MAG: SPOR domain-containing protein [Phycisphaerales bacterium]